MLIRFLLSGSVSREAPCCSMRDIVVAQVRGLSALNGTPSWPFFFSILLPHALPGCSVGILAVLFFGHSKADYGK